MGLHISLPKELENLIHKEVDTGLYGSASELVREALRDFFDRVSDRKIRSVSDFKEEMQERLRQVSAGEIEIIDGDAAFRNLSAKYGLEE